MRGAYLLVGALFCADCKLKIPLSPVPDKANAAHSLKNFLAVSDDKEKLASIIAPNFDRDYWSSFEVKEAKKIWKKL